MRGSKRNYQNNKGRANKYQYNNYDCISIENLMIKKSKYKSEYDAQNKNYGTEYEDSIVTKSCVNLNIKSINERKVYARQYRHFFGLKVLMLNKKNISFNLKDYVENPLDTGKFKVIPLSRDYYEMYLNGYKKYYICYNKGISIYDDNDKIYKLSYVKKHAELHIESMTSNTNTYAGTLNLHNSKRYKSDIDILFYEAEVEVDGLFDILSDIALSNFKPKYYIQIIMILFSKIIHC